MRVFPLGSRLALVIVFSIFGIGRSLELYQFPPPPPMKPGWGSLPEVDSPQVVGLKVGDIDCTPLQSAWQRTLAPCRIKIRSVQPLPASPIPGSIVVCTKLSGRTDHTKGSCWSAQKDIQRALDLSPGEALAAKAIFGIEPKVCADVQPYASAVDM